jgi:tRNA pseudouridine55 synthase
MILVVNKTKDFTSRDVVNKLTHIFHTKKIGHTGTLDPIATGVLACCIDEDTKLVEILTSDQKEYIATMKLGIETDTLDITGNTINTKEFNVNKELIINTLNSFLGETMQEVPLYSAIKINGKKLYEYAREGIEVELPKHKINIYEIELLEYNNDLIKFRVLVSKGTYIRSLIRDIAHKLNTVGTMTDLIRTKQGDFRIEDSYTLEEIENGNYKTITREEVLSYLESYDVDDKEYQSIKNGNLLPNKYTNDIVSLKYNNKIVALYQKYEKDNNFYKPYKMFIKE